MSNRSIVMKGLLLVLCLALLLPVLVACGKGASPNDNQESVLRIATNMYGDDDSYFRSQFTEVFEFAHRNIRIETVPIFSDAYYGAVKEGEERTSPFDQLKQLMEGANPPDVVMIDYSLLPELVNQNMLMPLEPLIAKDNFDIADIVPSVLEGIKRVGDNKLYALAPMFSSNALIYNKQLFIAAGVPFPTDNMTWDEMFDLARRVSRGDGENRKYGFAFAPYTYASENLFYEMNNYISPLQLNFFDSTTNKMTVDSDQWERVWRTLIQLNNEKVFPEPQNNSGMGRDFAINSAAGMSTRVFSPYSHDLFLSGQVAMTIMHIWNINEVINANKRAHMIENFQPIEWDLATLPVHPEAPGIGSSVNYDGLMGINARAQNAEAAWAFLKFINGPDWASIKSRSAQQLVSRKQYIKPKDGMDYNIAALYQLAPSPMPLQINDMNAMERYYQAQNIGREFFNQALKGDKGIREALKEWEVAGNSMLQQMAENAGSGGVGGGGGIAVPMPAVELKF